MRPVWPLLAVAAALSVVGLYLAGGDADKRAATSGRTHAAAEPEPAAPEAPPDGKAAPAARIFVCDTDRKPVADAVVGFVRDGKSSGDTARTGADGRCALPLPDAQWHQVAVRHLDFVQACAWVRVADPDAEIVLGRGPRLTVLVLGPAREPVAGATVDVAWEQSRGASGVWRWSDGDTLGEFKTDAEGRAVVGAVPQARVVVNVDRPPFALHESGLDATGDAPIEHVVRLDAGGILMGRVVAPGGEGVAGATVKCASLARPVGTSGPRGEFRLEGVASGSAQLVAEAEGFGPGFFGAALGWGQPVPIPLRAGETLTGLEIILSKPVCVLGRIVDDAGGPVQDVSCQAWIQRGFALDREAKSDADGRFRVGPFNVREPGQAWAWFQAPAHAIEQVQGRAEPGKDVDLGDVKATRRATVRGVLVDAGGHPVEGQVNVVSDRWIYMAASAKPDGTFEMAGVGPGSLTLVAERADAPALKSRPVVLQTIAGQAIEGVEIVLLEAKPIGGRVITPDGRPRPGTVLGIRPEGASAILQGQAVTNNDGEFRFFNLADGEYEVGLMRRGEDIGDEPGFLEQPAPVRVTAGRLDVEFIDPIKGGIVMGKAVAKRDGRPLKEFDATFLRYKLFIPSDSDYESYRDGEFRYETDEPGTWQVEISATGFAAHRTERFNLAAGEVKDLGTIKLGPGGTIAGAVLDAQQRPVPYARINILNDKLQTNDDEPYTDLEGRFEVKGVSPGLFTVFAVSPRHPLGMVRGVEVREGETTAVQVTFVEPAPLTIDVRDPSGQPVAGAALDFTFPAVAPLTSKLFRGKIPPGYGSHLSDAEGTILQPCLPPGEVTITIEAQGFEPLTKKLDLKPGEPNRVEIRLRRAGG